MNKESDSLHRFLSESIFSPSKSLLTGRFATQRGDLCNTFRRPDGGVEGDRSSRNLPEQSAASRCRLIVSESRGSEGRVPALPEWKQISSFTRRFVEGAHFPSTESIIGGRAGDKRRALGWSRQPNKCTFVKRG